MASKLHVDFCMTNLAEGSLDVWDRLEAEFGDQIDLKEIGCLGLCDMCDLGPYCIVDDVVIRAATAEDLYPQVADAIRFRLSNKGKATAWW